MTAMQMDSAGASLAARPSFVTTWPRHAPDVKRMLEYLECVARLNGVIS